MQWKAVISMAFTAFVLVSSEFMPVSLLTSIASEFGVSEGQIGFYSISISGAFALISSLFISTIAGNIDRKKIVLSLIVLMVISSAMVAFSTNYLLFVVGRAIIGIVVGGFWGMSSAVTIQLVTYKQIPSAIALVNTGSALATVIAAPVASYLGHLLGWRSAFLCLVPLSFISLIALYFTLPNIKAKTANSVTGILKMMRQRHVHRGMMAVGLFFMGQMCVFTYLRPFLEYSVQLTASSLSLAFLTIGSCGVLGTIFVGNFLKYDVFRLSIWLPILMSSIAIFLTQFVQVTFVIFALLGLWGVVSTMVPVGWGTWLTKTLPDNTEMGGGIMVAIVQLSIAIGSTLGGFAYDYYGYQLTFFAGAGILFFSALLSKSTKSVTRNFSEPVLKLKT